MSVKKIPPPQTLTGPEFEGFNRWLLELTGILNAGGTIDPADVDGLPELIVQVATLAVQVFALSGQVTANTAGIAANTADIATNTAAIAASATAITALQARGELLFGAGAPAAGLGKVNDWYGDPAGAAGARIWIKTAIGTWTAFPF